MANTIASVVEVQLDVSKAVTNATEVKDILDVLKKASANVSNVITKAFNPMQNGLKEIRSEADTTSTSIARIVEELSGVKTSAEAIQGIRGLFNGIASGYDGAKSFVNELESIEKYSEKFKNIFSQVAEAPNMGALLENVLPKTSQLFGTVSTWADDHVFKTIGDVLGKGGGTIGTAASNMLNSITGAFKGIGSALSGLSLGWGVAIAGIVALIVLLITNWDSIKAAVISGWEAIMQFVGPIVDWLNINVVQPIVNIFASTVGAIFTKLQEGFAQAQVIFAAVSAFLAGAFATDWTEQFGAFGNVLNAFFANVENIWNAVKSIFGGIVDFVKNVFAGDWGAAWDSIVKTFQGIWDLLISIVKAPINGIIGLINGLIQGVVGGINLVIGALNKLQFTIPEWIPELGGMTFGFNLKLLSAPQIPYLAQGAVLPANKPFLAVVGDQKHGTNVEAPLTTIQEAVAVVMGDQIAAMMAGFEALLKEQRATRQTIEGIEIGDTVIGRAAERYGRKMAVARGVY